MELPDFVRAFALRAPRLAVFLGAGASVSSGIPSAAQLVRQFKRSIYATETGTHPARVASMVDPNVEETVQRYFDARPNFPRPGDANEYSFYFERAYPDSGDRRLFIGKQTEDRRPAYGYLCLGAVLGAGKCRFVWTTNFDDLVEQGFSLVAEGRAASVVGRDTSARLDTYLRDERYPLVVKVHGDFRFDALQNTTSEIASCDSAIRDSLVENSRGYGLVLVGYSGRDASVMSTLSAVLDTHGAKAFPDGLYWCLREEDWRPAAAEDLLRRAASLGVRAAFVRIPDFDDFAAGLYRACALQHPIVDRKLAERQRERAGYELGLSGQLEPVLKFNAVPVTSFPERCYRFKAEVKGWSDLRSLTDGREVVAGLFKGQVFALGRRSDVEQAFGQRGISDLQLSSIVSELGVTDSVVLGIFYEALARALTADEKSPLRQPGESRRSRLLYLRRSHALGEALESEFRGLGIRDANAVVRETRRGYWIHEGIRLSLDFREGKLWLLFEPTVFLSTDGDSVVWESEEKAETIRELRAQRYNKQVSGLLTFWHKVLGRCTPDGILRFPPGADGFEFRLERTLGISYQQP